jgi:hypothetical protein
LHANPDAGNIPALALQRRKKVRGTLADDRGARAGIGCERQFAILGCRDADSFREWAGEEPANDSAKRFQPPAPLVPLPERRVVGQDLLHGPRRRRSHGKRGRPVRRHVTSR